jgi:hypothetical protein
VGRGDPGQADGQEVIADGEGIVAQTAAQRHALARLRQAPGGVLADGLRHPVAALAGRSGLDLDQGLTSQAGQQAGDPARGQAVVGAEPLGRLQRPAREHRQPPEQDPLVGAEQVMTPVQCGPQLAAGRRAGLVQAGRLPEPGVEAGRDLLDGQDRDPGRGQLDGQRQPAQRPADPGHGGAVARAEDEARRGRRGAAFEEPDRVIAGGPLRVLRGGGAGGRQLKPGHRPGRLARRPQGSPAGGNDEQSGRAGH